jgi:hypothetical protein
LTDQLTASAQNVTISHRSLIRYRDKTIGNVEGVKHLYFLDIHLHQSSLTLASIMHILHKFYHHRARQYRGRRTMAINSMGALPIAITNTHGERKEIKRSPRREDAGICPSLLRSFSGSGSMTILINHIQLKSKSSNSAA